jgi:hypothetical protein
MPDHPSTGLFRGDLPALLAAFERSGLETPSFVLDETRFRRNGEILKRVQDETGAKILLAQKAFACFGLYPLLRDYLVGTAASGLHEARLGHEEFGGEVHVFSPAYKPAEMTEVLKIADHLVFNSLSQWHRYRDEVLAAAPRVSAGLRINPEYSEAVAEIYDPCAPGSRFGMLARLLEGADRSYAGAAAATAAATINDWLEGARRLDDSDMNYWSIYGSVTPPASLDRLLLAAAAIDDTPLVGTMARAAEIQLECLADDLQLSDAMCSWSEKRLRDYFETGGA